MNGKTMEEGGHYEWKREREREKGQALELVIKREWLRVS